jgi:2-polyprenyl-3-methyl-5-hydroxy-6-metoxy-1,4-benzoquinol methylase
MPKSNHDASATIGAHEFHKKTGITDQLRETEDSFRKKFMDVKTGKVFNKYVRRRSCPLCNDNQGEVVFVKNGFDHLHCPCGMIYVAEVLRDDYLNLVYENHTFEEETHKSFRTEPRRSFIQAVYQDGLDLLRKYGVQGGRLFDIGCSSGLFMEYARGRGFHVKGIEPSNYAVELAKEYNLDVTQGYFQKDTCKECSFDIITMWDVLEHCDAPDDILEAVYQTLVPGGVVFIQVPNVMGLAPRIMRQDCNMFTGFGHINLFGPETIKKILTDNQFKDIQMQSVISEISVINNYINYHDPYFGPSLEREHFLGCLDVETILNNLWGYKLQVVGRKDN